MYQQVNFYELIAPPAPPKWSAEQFLQMGVGVCILLLLISGGSVWEKNKLQKSVNALTAAQLAVQTQVDELKKTNAARKADTQVLRDIESIKEGIKNRRAMIDVLNKQKAKNGLGFSSQLIALGNQKIEGLWLSNIVLGRGGEVMLAGSMYQAALLPAYLEKLGSEKAFEGTVFDSLVLKTEGGDKPLEFTVRTKLSTDVKK